MKRDFYYTIAKIFALVASVFVFGCAPANKPGAGSTTNINRLSAIAGVSSFGGGAAAAVDDADWNCPTSANVTLKNNIGENGYDYTGNDSFKVCYSRSNPANFKITGVTSYSSICVYPLRTGYSQGTSTYTTMPALVDKPQCYPITGSAIYANFTQGDDINYMVIVDANYTQAMDDCLSSTSACPAHSEGFVE